ncbi:hypothetical protein MTBSS4_40283 [Magnetospirillum sp. SS-4]|nr:hypothetical protein MTBSS4_40283 [Magnetospirillum sp. SS-4]
MPRIGEDATLCPTEDTPRAERRRRPPLSRLWKTRTRQPAAISPGADHQPPGAMEWE